MIIIYYRNSDNDVMPPLLWLRQPRHHPYDRPTVGQGCAHTERRARTLMLPFYDQQVRHRRWQPKVATEGGNRRWQPKVATEGGNR